MEGIQYPPVNPKPYLYGLVGKEVRVRLKWAESEYVGRLVSTDSYMNLLVQNATEFIEGKDKGTLGQVLIRCNNVLWIGHADPSGDKMEQ